MLSAFVFRTMNRGADGGAASASGPMTRTAGSTERPSDYTKGERRGSSSRSRSTSASGLLPVFVRADALLALCKRGSKGTGRAASGAEARPCLFMASV